MRLNIIKQMCYLVNINRKIALIVKVNRYSSFQSAFSVNYVAHCIKDKYKPNALLTQTRLVCGQLNVIRYKSKKVKTKGKGADTDVESDDDDETKVQEEGEVPAGAKDIKASLTSLRIDGVLKAGLGIPKSKIEDEFYESKIYLNGKKILKKSYQARIGDEVDLVLGQSSLNKEFIQVSRVVIIKVDETESGKVIVKLRRFKNLLIEDYTKV